MKYDAKVIKHSISNLGNEVITWELTLPKWLLAEFNTHKIEIERNSASSRAVPTKLIIDMLEEFPCMPVEWRYNQSGMQGADLLNDEDEEYAKIVYRETRDLVIKQVYKLNKLPSGRSVAKQTANRLLEAWMWTKVVCTMTGGGKIGINNFFGLRDTEFAQPEFRVISHMMHDQWHTSKPVERLWHLPYITGELEEIGIKTEKELEKLGIDLAIMSSARCGRVTHYRQGLEYSQEEDIKRGMSFADNGHFSPLRHASRAGGNTWYGNFYGWEQVSKIIMPQDFITHCCEKAR